MFIDNIRAEIRQQQAAAQHSWKTYEQVELEQQRRSANVVSHIETLRTMLDYYADHKGRS